MEPLRGRFAPSPSGRMHLGNVFTALLAWLSVRSAGGTLVLQMEDLDPDRCREEVCPGPGGGSALAGPGLGRGISNGGPHGPYRQSERTELYAARFRQLEQMGLVYPASAPAERLATSAPTRGMGEILYSWTLPLPSPQGRRS